MPQDIQSSRSEKPEACLQITTIPPMHIYPGKRASLSNILEGCVDGAYYGRSNKGWMTTELFYGVLANHFAKQIPPERPVL